MRERERAVQQSGERGAWADAKKSNQKTAMERGRTHADARTRDVPLVVISRAFFYFSKIKKKL